VFEPRISLLEIVLRVLLIYLFLLVAMRLFGKKEMGRWTPMEFLGMLLLARTVGPALIGGDSSLPVAAVAALTLLGVTYFLDYLVHRSRRLEGLIEGRPELLIEDGRVSEKTMRREMLTEQQLLAALRRENVESPEEVSRAFIESDGRITIIPRRKAVSSPFLRLRRPAAPRPVANRHVFCRKICREQSRPRCDHLEERNDGQIRQEGAGEGRKGHARTQRGKTEVRSFRKKGDEPQTGDRHRALRGAPRRRQGAPEEVLFLEEEVVVETRPITGRS